MLFYIVLLTCRSSLKKVLINLEMTKPRQREGRGAGGSGWFCRINLSIYIIINYQLYWSIHIDVWTHSAKGPSEMENGKRSFIRIDECWVSALYWNKTTAQRTEWLPSQCYMAMGQQIWVNQQGWVASQISCPVQLKTRLGFPWVQKPIYIPHYSSCFYPSSFRELHSWIQNTYAHNSHFTSSYGS